MKASEVDQGHTAMDLADKRHIVTVAQQDADMFVPAGVEESMLDGPQMAVLHWLTRLTFEGSGNIAELGAYVGGTTRVFGEALRRLGLTRRCLEVYDLFEHNDASRRRLARHPQFDERDFFGIWQANTVEYESLIDLRRGDLRTTAAVAGDRPLEILYVDIVKHPAVIAPVVQQLLPRLRPGGVLIHQDYFHWQSPWVVYSTERLMSYFEILGTVSNHMMVLGLRKRIPPRLLRVDDVDEVSVDEKIRLMRRAIERYPGVRSGLLRVSLLNLMLDEPDFDFELEASSIRSDHGVRSTSRRVIRYLEAVEAQHERTDGRSPW